MAVAILSGTAIAAAEDQGAPASGEIVILALGDSLTAGYLLPPAQSFPAQLEAALRAKGHRVHVINSGVSGETASDGLNRLDWALSERIDAAIVEFGANEALRGMPPKTAETGLDTIITRLKAQNVEVLLAGMEAPRNLGPAYVEEFRAIYPRLAAKHGVALYPFFLDGVAGNRALNLVDGIHPTGEGVGIIVQRILPTVEQLIAKAKARPARGVAG